MLRIYFLQQWFNMSDPQAKESLYDSAAMRNFVGIDLGNAAAPDETTICKFRHLIEAKGLSKMMLTARWSQACCMVRRRRFGATLPIRVRQKRSGLLPPLRRT